MACFRFVPAHFSRGSGSNHSSGSLVSRRSGRLGKKTTVEAPFIAPLVSISLHDPVDQLGPGQESAAAATADGQPEAEQASILAYDDPLSPIPEEDDVPAPDMGTREEPFVIDAEDVMENVRAASLTGLYQLFPDICPNFLEEQGRLLDYQYDAIATGILDMVESGTAYPKRAQGEKRRRVSSGSEGSGTGHGASGSGAGNGGAAGGAGATGAAGGAGGVVGPRHIGPLAKGMDETQARQMYEDNNWDRPKRHKDYLHMSRLLFQQAFPRVPYKIIVKVFNDGNQCLLPSVLYLDRLVNEGCEEEKGLWGPLFKHRATPLRPEFEDARLEDTLARTDNVFKREALEEFCVAKTLVNQKWEKRMIKRQRQADEEANMLQAQADGTVADCECCFGEYALNRMVHCDGAFLHWFCRDCARRMAETEIGLSKYKLCCMSTDGCQAGFAADQRALFVDGKTAMALDRLEQEHSLRMAGITDLETCPFCPFAAEYPPVAENKEFRCQNPECEQVSCRLCHKATHIPLTCEEFLRSTGMEARLAIEEAMSLAMIRKCNKCGTSFVKETGCNKMTCTKPGCGNVQCYVCHKSCSYSHFDDSTRGGKKGNCPLFEATAKRHEKEVTAAEERAREEVLRKNPAVNAELLKFKLSQRVLDDERRQQEAEARY